MTNTRNSVVSAAGVIASVAVIVVGLLARERADLGVVKPTATVASIDRLLASRTDDLNVPAGDYFYELSQKLKEQYVEPVTDEQKLASGAVRGMISSLRDPQSLYMDKTQFSAFINAREGKFEGIGADFALVTGPKSTQAEAIQETPGADSSPEDTMATVRDIPRLQVVSVVPGGPADKAGVQIGDTVYSVDGHWVVNSDLVRKFRAAQKAFLAKNMKLSELNVLRNEIRAKADHAILPLKAKDMLFMGKSGVVSVVWDRAGTQRTTKIGKAPSTLPAFGVRDGQITLPFIPSSVQPLKHEIAGKAAVTIDLRNNTMGDLATMKQCLEIIAPKGQYGTFNTYRHESPTSLVVKNGNPSPPKITLITDKSTRGVAEMFALALSSRGVARLSGSETGGDRDNRTIVRLPDGSGYTIVTSVYKPTLGTTTTAHKGGAK